MEHNDAMDFAFQNIDLPMLSISDEGALCGLNIREEIRQRMNASVFRLNEQSGWIVKRKEMDHLEECSNNGDSPEWAVKTYGTTSDTPPR